MRMRGTPAFTAIAVESGGELETIANALESIAVTLKVGIVITMPVGEDAEPGGTTLLSMMAEAANRDVESIRASDGVGFGCTLR